MDQPLLHPYLALCFLYCGIVMGMIYGIFDLIRISIKSKLLNHTFDGCCAFILGCTFIIVSFLTTGISLRFYPLLMTALGFYIEQTVVHKPLLTIRSKRIHKTTSQYQ